MHQLTTGASEFSSAACPKLFSLCHLSNAAQIFYAFYTLAYLNDKDEAGIGGVGVDQDA